MNPTMRKANFTANTFILTFSNAGAMASTFLLFLAVSRKSSVTDIAAFSALTMLLNLIQQLGNRGASQLVIRSSAENPENINGHFKWLINRQLVQSGIWALISLPIVYFYSHSLLVIAFFPVNVIFIVIYSNSLYLFQAEKSFIKSALTQLLNTLGFVLSATIALTQTHNLSVEQSFALYFLAYFPCFIFSLYFLSRRVFYCKTLPIKASEISTISSTLIFNLITSSFVLIFVGFFNSDLSGQYSLFLQPALLFAPISIALTTVLLPIYASKKHESHVLVIRQLSKLFICFPIAGIVIAVPIFVLIAPIYNQASFTNLGLQLIYAAYAMGVYMAVLSTWLISKRYSKIPRNWAAIQCVITVVFSIVALISDQLIVLLLGDLITRTLGSLYLMVAFFRLSSSKENEYENT